MPRSTLFMIAVMIFVSAGSCESVWVSHLLGAELYETHSANSESVARLPFGTELRVMDEYHEPATYDLWYMVDATEGRGWIPAGYVDGSAPSGYSDAPLVAAASAAYRLMLSGGNAEGVGISPPLTVEYSSYDRFNGNGQGSTGVDSIQELEGGIGIPVMYDGQGWSREEPATEPYGETVEVDIPGRLRHAQANSYEQFRAPRFDVYSDSLSCIIFTGSHWYVHFFFDGEREEQLELVGIRYTTVDPG